MRFGEAYRHLTNNIKCIELSPTTHIDKGRVTCELIQSTFKDNGALIDERFQLSYVCHAIRRRYLSSPCSMSFNITISELIWAARKPAGIIPPRLKLGKKRADLMGFDLQYLCKATSTPVYDLYCLWIVDAILVGSDAHNWTW